jgi:hypothetical protein
MTLQLPQTMPHATGTDLGFVTPNSATNNTIVSGRGALFAQGMIAHVPQDTGCAPHTL